LFHTGSAHGIHPSEAFSSREVSETFGPGRTHLPLAGRYYHRQSGKPARQASVSRFMPREIALQSCGRLNRGSPAPPLDFALQGIVQRPWLNFLSHPLSCLAGPAENTAVPSTPQSINQPSHRPARPKCHRHRPAKATLMGFLHLPAPEHSGKAVPGLYIDLLAGACITADSPTIFGHQLNPAEAV